MKAGKQKVPLQTGAESSQTEKVNHFSLVYNAKVFILLLKGAWVYTRHQDSTSAFLFIGCFL